MPLGGGPVAPEHGLPGAPPSERSTRLAMSCAVRPFLSTSARPLGAVWRGPMESGPGHPPCGLLVPRVRTGTVLVMRGLSLAARARTTTGRAGTTAARPITTSTRDRRTATIRAAEAPLLGSHASVIPVGDPWISRAQPCASDVDLWWASTRLGGTAQGALETCGERRQNPPLLHTEKAFFPRPWTAHKPPRSLELRLLEGLSVHLQSPPL